MHKAKKTPKSDRFKTRHSMLELLGKPMAALLICVHFVPENAADIQKMSGMYTKNVRLAHKNARLHRSFGLTDNLARRLLIAITHVQTRPSLKQPKEIKMDTCIIFSDFICFLPFTRQILHWCNFTSIIRFPIHAHRNRHIRSPPPS